jgi:hypothetical protein
LEISLSSVALDPTASCPLQETSKTNLLQTEPRLESIE